MEKVIIYGVTLFTSDKLKDQLKKIIKNEGSSLSKDILVNLVDSGILIPLINEPNKIKQFINKLRKKEPLESIIGTMKNGKLYVIVSHSVENSIILNTCIHESIHFAKLQFPKSFTSFNMPLYVRFYSELFKKYLNSKSYDKEYFTKFMKRVTTISKRNIVYYSTYDDILFKAFSEHTKLSKKIFNEKINSLVDFIDKFYSTPNVKLNPEDKLIQYWITRTYISVFGKRPSLYNVVGQEIWYADEIISVLSEMNPDHPNIIESLKLIKPGKIPVLKNVKKLIK